MRVLRIGLFLLMYCVCVHNALAQTEQGTLITRLHIPGAEKVAWSNDSSKLAISTSEQITVWDTQNWQLLYHIPDAYAHAIDWHPTRNELAGLQVGRQIQVSIWDGDTGELLKCIGRERPDGIVGPAVARDLAWNPDGTRIASDSVSNTILLWDIDAESTTEITPPDAYHNVLELSWSSDGKYLLSAGLDQTIRVWDVRTGKNTATVYGYKYATWNPEGTHFAGAGEANCVNIWRLETLEIEQQFCGHTSTVTSVDWNNNGNMLSSTDADKHLFLWDVLSGTQVRSEFSADFDAWNAVWSPDGLRLAIVTLEDVVIAGW